tara:strand:- start:299 stop:574 length:276 start_codon:yes stop_codon:yes gene_type:complete
MMTDKELFKLCETEEGCLNEMTIGKELLSELADTRWKCTSELRWLTTDRINSRGEKWDGLSLRVLQQAWVSVTGEIEYKDVPTVYKAGDLW